MTTEAKVVIGLNNLVIGGGDEVDLHVPSFSPLVIPLGEFDKYLTNAGVIKEVWLGNRKITITINVAGIKPLVDVVKNKTYTDAAPGQYSFIGTLDPEDFKVEDPNSALWSARIKGTFDINLP